MLAAWQGTFACAMREWSVENTYERGRVLEKVAASFAFVNSVFARWITALFALAIVPSCDPWAGMSTTYDRGAIVCLPRDGWHMMCISEPWSFDAHASHRTE